MMVSEEVKRTVEDEPAGYQMWCDVTDATRKCSFLLRCRLATDTAVLNQTT